MIALGEQLWHKSNGWRPVSLTIPPEAAAAAGRLPSEIEGGGRCEREYH